MYPLISIRNSDVLTHLNEYRDSNIRSFMIFITQKLGLLVEKGHQTLNAVRSRELGTRPVAIDVPVLVHVCFRWYAGRHVPASDADIHHRWCRIALSNNLPS